MAADHRAKLAGIRRFDQLIAYLRDELGWPLGSDDFEELTFEYTPEELGIRGKDTAKIETIRRLRPLAPAQPWGIFFVKFEPKQLPVVALRRILGRVALKQRASANASDRQAWAMEDLLFVSNYGEGQSRHISFAHFSAPQRGRILPTLKVLGWDNRDTALHLDAVARGLADHLAWPEDEGDADGWREQWRSAFSVRHREVVTTSQQLSVRLATLARGIRDLTRTALGIETKKGPIGRLMEAFKQGLVHDLDAGKFADMYAQTIAYGLLSARIADPRHGTADDFAAHMRTNPLLRDLMQAFLQAGSRGSRASPGIDFDELGVSDVVELLDDANMEAVIRDFGDRNPREDPVIHFYELFLKEYDAEERMQRGVFYTPRPVVSYIVRSIDSLLRTRYGLEDGLADTATWGDMTRQGTVRIPDGVSSDQDFVRILDPATGTGTFLVEAIDVIHKTLVAKWRSQGSSQRRIGALWNDYVPRHLLPRLHGYELLMAPYAIAHMKIGLKLYETGYRFGADERVRVYLTNALEPADDFSGLMDFAIPALADEAHAVNEVKRSACFTVVLGNPPYAGHSANKGAWIAGLLRGEDRKEATQSYFTVDGAPLGERNPKWLNDDYVKFLRFGQRQIELTNVGVLGFITNHSYLDNQTFRGMREALSETFDCVRVLDLHGNAKKDENGPSGVRDQNVFDIQQGVAIGLFAKGGPATRHRVGHAELWGARDGGKGSKYEWLIRSDVDATDWVGLPCRPGLRLFVPRDEALWDEYETGWPLVDIFSIKVLGFQSHRDSFAVSFDQARIEERLADMLDEDLPDGDLMARYKLRETRDWKVANARAVLQGMDTPNANVRHCAYRPFDQRWCFLGREFMDRPRTELMLHVAGRDNVCLNVVRQTKRSDWTHALVSTDPTPAVFLEVKDGSTVLPLYAYPGGGGKPGRVANLRMDFVRRLRVETGLDFVPDGQGDLATTFGPDDVLHYLYATLYSPDYRGRYGAFLKSGFPRVWLPGHASLFGALVSLGRQLASDHLLRVRGGSDKPSYAAALATGIEKVRYTAPADGVPGRVWVSATEYFEGVSPGVWEFAVGGYRPAEKWLKDRKGRSLSPDDVAHYKRIVAALAETIDLMARITQAIDRYGGWPAAFRPGAPGAGAAVIPFRPRVVVPKPSERYATCVPLIPLRAAAGAFSDPQYVEDDGHEWIAIETGHRLRPGMFVAQVVGESMEPVIPDGAYCLFRAPVQGTRQGKTVLVQLRDATDPETGQRYTVKRYESSKASSADAWRHATVRLRPANHAFEPIVLTEVDEGELQVVAEFLEVLRPAGDE